MKIPGTSASMPKEQRIYRTQVLVGIPTLFHRLYDSLHGLRDRGGAQELGQMPWLIVTLAPARSSYNMNVSFFHSIFYFILKIGHLRVLTVA